MAKSQKEQIKELKRQLREAQFEEGKRNERLAELIEENQKLKADLGLDVEPSHMDLIRKIETDALVEITDIVKTTEEKTGRSLQASSCTNEVGVDPDFLIRATYPGGKLRSAMTQLGKTLSKDYNFTNVDEFIIWAKPIIRDAWIRSKDLK